MALAHKGLSAESIPVVFYREGRHRPAQVRKGAGAARRRKLGRPIPGRSRIISRNAIPDRPSLFGGAGGRAMARMINWWGDITVVGGMFPLIVADIPPHLKPVDADYFRQESRSAFRQAAGRGGGRPRQGRRGLSPRARSVAADAEDAKLSRRRYAELRRLHRVRPVPVGARGQPVQCCSPKTIRSTPGARNCSMPSTAWRADRRAIRCSGRRTVRQDTRDP